MVKTPFIPLSSHEQCTLLDVAREHIRMHLITGKQLHIDESLFDDALQQHVGNYVRLVKNGKTRGHIGSLSPQNPLIASTSQHAYDAAFEDPRFPPLCRDEESQVRIEITVLTPPEPVTFTSQQNLLEQLAPDRDGIIVSSGVHRAHYLPSDWQRFSNPPEFVCALKSEAGLTTSDWSSDITVERFQAIHFSD